ncbi:hypothetical protein AURANDRAFT_68432, partial [Aureococcus anophagefferens]
MKRNALLLLALAVVAKAGSESGAVSAGGGSFDSACTDSTTWHKKGDDKKNCAWVGKKKVNRCKAWVKSEDGVLASVACPVACDTCLLICEEAKQDLEETLAEEKQTCAEEKQTCAEEKQTCAEEKAALEGPSCADSTTWHQGWKKSKTCAWVGKSPAKRCDKESKSKVLASDACPVACDACPTWAEVIAELEAANAALEGKVAELEAKLEAPTPAPTVDPTASPMTAPTATPTAAPMAFTCAADEYFDGCTECPNGYTCDGVTKTCAVNKYVDNNECLECPASATCDGVNAVCDDVNNELKTQNTDKLCTGKLSAEDEVNMVAVEETYEEAMTTTATTMTTKTTDENEDDPVMCSELKTQNTDKLCTGKLSAEDKVNMVAVEETDEGGHLDSGNCGEGGEAYATATAATATTVDDCSADGGVGAALAYGDDSGHLDSGNCDDDGGEANATASGSFAYYRDEVNLVIDCSGKVNPTASWSFEMRYALADAVAGLPECVGSTMEVVHIIYGSSRVLSKGKHTVDFAMLSDGVCAQLQAFVNLKSNLNDLEETLAEEKQTCAEEKQTCAEEKQTCAEEKAALEGPSCADSTTWHQGWKKSKSCAWVGKSPAKRCDKESKSKVLASDACPVACDACPTWAEVIAELEAANAALEGKVAELEAKLEAPTPAPTVDPTASPMTAPTATPTAAPMAFTCAADEYFDGCSECPNGYTCDGVTKTCAVNKYVDNNECLECPASAKCDGVNAVCDDVNKYVDENNECLECPTGFACDGIDATFSPTDLNELKIA